MKQQKIIGVFGCEQTDICIYLASILENMKFRVLVIDNSFEQKMRFCIPKPKEKLQTVTYKNVDYSSMCEQTMWKSEAYDYVIVNLGNWPEETVFLACDEVICTMNCEASEIAKYREILKRMKVPVNIVFRDFCKNYMSAANVRRQLKLNNCFVMEHIFLPFSEMDECIRLMMQFEGYQNFTNLSREFEKALFYLCHCISEQDSKNILEGLKRAKRGECF